MAQQPVHVALGVQGARGHPRCQRPICVAVGVTQKQSQVKAVTLYVTKSLTTLIWFLINQ
jgi:hypothetical protein